MNRKKIKPIFIVLILLLTILSCLYLYLNSISSSKINYINKLRLDSNTIYERIISIWPLDDDEINAINKDLSQNDNMHLTIVDLSEKIIYSNSNTLIASHNTFLLNALYMDNSYVNSNKDSYKLSQPIYYNNIVVAFAIFEKTYGTEYGNIVAFKTIIISTIILIILMIIMLTSILLFGKNKTELDAVEDGLRSIVKGVLQPLPIKQDSDYNGVYNAYNMLIEELVYIMKKQQSYEGKRKAFLTMISHELKTPIATINAYIEGLVSGVAKDEEAKEKYLAIISNKMQQLTIQVEDFFKYAQEDDNKLKYNFEECYADELLDKIFSSFINAERPQTKIQNLLPKCIFSVDKIRIEQVIMNLYNNALKHTAPEDVIIFKAYREDDEVVIEIEDFGEGINSKDLPYIFDSYYQGQNSKMSDYEGVGLGLAICKAVIDKHNGSMKAKSSLGRGTTMYIKIPLV